MTQFRSETQGAPKGEFSSQATFRQVNPPRHFNA